MRRGWLIAGVLSVLAFAAAYGQKPAGGQVYLLQIKGGIGPATSDYLQRGLKRAGAEGATAVVLRIDTPGGLDAATRDINQAILASPVPVIGWVAPEGARAASAGTYILYACHLAAMAPATSLGAATPVSLGGGTPGGEAPPSEPEAEDGDDAKDKDKEGSDSEDAKARKVPPGGAMERKVVNDAVAYIRSLAELRGRNTDFAEAAVRRAATLTASQALEQGVIEILAADIDDLLRQADGRKVKLGDAEVAIASAGRSVQSIEPDWRSRLLSVVTEPSVAYLLLLVGLYGLVFEGYSPGAVLPGVVGAICLLLALYALQVLPVNYAGVLLIVLGVALMVTEMFLPSFGALGIGGVVALVAGSLLLFDTEVPGFGVPGRLILGVGMASGLLFLGALYLAVRARYRPVTTGANEMLGHTALAEEDFAERGHVRIRGESWQALTSAPVRRGQPVRVLALDGLILRVEPLPEGQSSLTGARS